MTGHTPRRLAAGIAVAGAAAIGGLALAAIDPIGAVGAQEATTTTVTDGAGVQRAPERGGHERVRRLLRGGLRIAAETLGMTPAELRAELREDRTVADGSLSEAQAAKLTDALPARLERMLTTPRSERPRGDRVAGGGD